MIVPTCSEDAADLARPRQRYVRNVGIENVHVVKGRKVPDTLVDVTAETGDVGHEPSVLGLHNSTVVEAAPYAGSELFKRLARRVRLQIERPLKDSNDQVRMETIVIAGLLHGICCSRTALCRL